MKYKYMSGIEVMEGDVVMVHSSGGRAEGVVLHVLIPNTPEAADWGLAEGGVMIQGGGIGPFFCESLEHDEDIVFMRRANNKP